MRLCNESQGLYLPEWTVALTGADQSLSMPETRISAAFTEAMLGVQHPDHRAGSLLYDLITSYELTETMEIGALHKATCLYASAAHLEAERGKHLVIDYDSAADRIEAIQSAAKKVGAESCCAFDLSPVSLHWRLMKLLRQPNRFDLCLLVGRQTWLHAGLGALLALRLLRPGGWLVLGDAGYRYIDDTGPPEYLTTGMSDEERNAPQVDLVFSQLLASEPDTRNAFKLGKLFGLQKSEKRKTAAGAPKSVMKVSSAIDAAYQRTIFDPDFRRALLDAPGEVLELLTSGAYDPEFWNIHFLDRPVGRLVVPAKKRGELHLLLPDPVWQGTISEEALEKLIMAAEERGRGVGSA